MFRALLAGLLVVGCVAVFAVSSVKAAPEAKETTTEGTVKSVDAEKHTLVVTDGEKKDHTFHAKEAAVTIDGKEGTLADVKEGATAKVTATGHKASKIEVTSAK